MNDWNIQSRSRVCQACGQPFADQAPYHTLLFEVKGELARQDVCVNCWDRQYSQGAQDRKGFISHWQGVYEAPPPAPKEPIQKETAETLLRKLVERNDPQYLAATYILAVMLERKRILKVKEQVYNEGRRIFVYEQAKTGDVFTIPDPLLQLNQLDEVHRVVARLLEHGLEPPPAPAPQTVNPPATEPLPPTPAAEETARTKLPGESVAAPLSPPGADPVQLPPPSPIAP